eukprot:NODE_279_length_10886_cov_0.340039.p8 type:complete len:164 gc:universal NODE_279_length_10886_cov_0.340039:4549-4058(-)
MTSLSYPLSTRGYHVFFKMTSLSYPLSARAAILFGNTPFYKQGSNRDMLSIVLVVVFVMGHLVRPHTGLATTAVNALGHQVATSIRGGSNPKKAAKLGVSDKRPPIRIDLFNPATFSDIVKSNERGKLKTFLDDYIGQSGNLADLMLQMKMATPHWIWQLKTI